MSGLSAHGITALPPDGWEARIFRHPQGEPTLHAASFPLPRQTGEFGAAATLAMPTSGAFVSLTEYRVDERLRPGVGLFAGKQPRRLAAAEFDPTQLLVARPGQLGLQRFFTTARRPFCLYVVIGSPAAFTHRLAEIHRLLRSVEIAPVGR